MFLEIFSPGVMAMKLPIILTVLTLVGFATVGLQDEKITPDAALAELKTGNDHHVQHRYQHPHETVERQRELVKGQHPHAEILSCADSRVPPEIIFDQGLGDLFVVRVAGNIATDAELASLEYGAAHLQIPLLVVMGHEHCGAVTAAVEGGNPEGHIGTLVELLRPAVENSRSLTGDRVENAVRANVELVVKQLRNSTPLLSELVAHNKLKIVGAVYSLDTGKVNWLPETK
jgi:Carbonic anhydrase